MEKKSSTINKNKIKKTKRKIKIKISNIAIQVTYLIILNEFLYQNKFVIETNTHIKFIEQQLKKKCKATYMKNLIKNQYSKKINLYEIKKKPKMNHTHLSKN